MRRFLLLGLLFAIGCGGVGNDLQARRIKERLDEEDAIKSDGRFVDAYWFRALETGTAIANIDAGEFNPEIEVYDEDGRLIAADDDSGAGDDARTSFRVQFGGFYEIVVTSNSEAETGRYELTVSPELRFDSVITRSRERKPLAAPKGGSASGL